MLYYFIGIIILFLSFISIFKIEIKKSGLILILICSLLYIISSIRFNIGTDYPYYYLFFESVKPLTFHPNYSFPSNYMEPMFMYTVAILKYLFDSPIFFFSFWSLISITFFWIGIKRESENYILSLFILYCIFYHHYFFNTIRQGVVMGIFIYSLTYIINRQTYKVLFISLSSSLIHSSGLFIFLAYMVSFLSLKSRISYILLLLSSIVIWKSGLGEKFFTFIALQFQDVIPNLYMYVKVFFYDHNLVQISQRLLLIIPLIYFYPKLSEDHKFRKLFSIYFFGTLIYFSFGFFGLFITRINMFFRILEIILIPILYERLKTKNQQILVQFCITIWCFTIMSWLLYKEAYYPFKSIFSIF